MSDPVQGYPSAVLSPHAILEMARRSISEQEVRSVLRDPPRISHVRPGRVVVTAYFEPPEANAYVLRVFVDQDRIPPVVVTAYRSSKIAKYWSQE